jgi:type II secretory pathway pseudopilin PulG
MVAKSKKAIAMIELIFSLVIMGIVLLSAPILIQQSIQSGNVALQQEAIAAGASQTAIVLSMHWDERNSNIPVGVSPILRSSRAPFDFNETTAPLGLINVASRNSADGNSTLSPSLILGTDETNDTDTNESDYTYFDDVDDYNNQTFGLLVFNNEVTTTDVGDYVDKNITMNTRINYTEDREDTGITALLNGTTLTLNSNINSTPLGAISNIKFVRVNLTSNSGINELDKNITFRAFSCNIGTFLPEDKGGL